MQFQSDLLNTNVVRPTVVETTALGAAYLAGLAVGYWSSTDDIQEQWQMERVFSPSMTEDQRKGLSDGWKRAINTAVSWSVNE